jgi:NADPH-dependent 2,4-dienoyl-CoA reductase/sulfur reductase-like enzyme
LAHHRRDCVRPPKTPRVLKTRGYYVEILPPAGARRQLGGLDGQAAKAAPAQRGRINADVCVVGAGYAELAAALRLKQAGRKVILLEARNRVSGRSLTGPLEGGGWIDYGGQWVGPTQDRFYELIKEMGGQTYPTHDHGAGLERSILDPAKFNRLTSD